MQPGNKVKVKSPVFKGADGVVLSIIKPEEAPTVLVRILNGPCYGLSLMFRPGDLEDGDGS